MAKTPTCPQCKIERSPETYTKNCEGCTKYHKQRAYDNKPNKYLEIVTHTTAEQQTCECGTPELQLNDDCKQCQYRHYWWWVQGIPYSLWGNHNKRRIDPSCALCPTPAWTITPSCSNCVERTFTDTNLARFQLAVHLKPVLWTTKTCKRCYAPAGVFTPGCHTCKRSAKVAETKKKAIQVGHETFQLVSNPGGDTTPGGVLCYTCSSYASDTPHAPGKDDSALICVPESRDYYRRNLNPPQDKPLFPVVLEHYYCAECGIKDAYLLDDCKTCHQRHYLRWKYGKPTMYSIYLQYKQDEKEKPYLCNGTKADGTTCDTPAMLFADGCARCYNRYQKRLSDLPNGTELIYPSPNVSISESQRWHTYRMGQLEEAIPHQPLKFTPWNMKAWANVV